MKLSMLINDIESDQLKKNLPRFFVGDTVKVGILIKEGNKERIQPYEGTIIAQHKAGLHTTITVRRIFQGIGVERVLPIHSPTVQEVKIIKRARVRKAKLYYLRDRVGKATRLKEKFDTNKKN
uniref:Large ribosomal subunit protein bL19c n=1 Tax=Binuclearia lauterbornii TaxID=3087189 RepID=A0A097KPD2_9CHLO|nr:ribosomal protein L19 [Binuclearia lauterbornii]AIT95035.1 ribosomal protein L19 [Binuclearia lauterbornii]